MQVYAQYAALEHINELLNEAEASRRAKPDEIRQPSRLSRFVASIKAALTDSSDEWLPTLREYPYA
jgi:hypothetical protein